MIYLIILSVISILFSIISMVYSYKNKNFINNNVLILLVLIPFLIIASNLALVLNVSDIEIKAYHIIYMVLICVTNILFTLLLYKVNESVIKKSIGKNNKDNKLLNAVNSVATLLLDTDAEKFDETLWKCMEIIGLNVNVDRVYIWKNHYQGSELYCTQIHEWSGGAEPQQGNELTVSVPFPDDWYPKLSVNKCVNGIVDNFPEYEREHLKAQGIISIIVVPVFLHNEFRGFFGLDDCKNKRNFTESEEAVLRSSGLLFAIGLLRNEMTLNLMKAREDAISSDRAKTEFLANMSHEIRTPINAITGMTNIARMTEDKFKIKECLDKVDAASRQLLSIINDVLDMSKIEAGKLTLANEPFELLTVINDVKMLIEIKAKEKNQTFTFEVDENLPGVIIGDNVRMAQVLLNLLSNAVKFTPEKGEVCLKAKLTGTREDGSYDLVLTVCDTGIGIKPEEVERLFNKFEQADGGTSRRFGGTGLGLAICKSIIDLIGGVIEVNSIPGEGSCFVVKFNAKPGIIKVEETDKKNVSLIKDFNGYRLLLVEDIEINREIVISLLADTGIAIDQAEDGQSAVEKFKTEPKGYDIILMDIHMPKMDGYEATKSIRALEDTESGRIPIIAMTANAFKEDVEKCLAAGMDDHIPKPLDFKNVLDKMEIYLNKSNNNE